MHFLDLFRILPRNAISYWIGRLAACPLPPFVLSRMIGGYCRYYQVNESEVALPRSAFRSMADYFVRELKAGQRPDPSCSEEVLVSPCDGTLRSYGSVRDGGIEEVKGRRYETAELLGDEYLALQFRGGSFLNCYLSPRDYHHVHSPVCGRIIHASHIRGTLWPVNDWSVNNVNNVYAENERVVTLIRNRLGTVAVIMVGALNVGNISTTYDSWRTNRQFRGPRLRRECHAYTHSPKEVLAGDRLGTFHLGSTVILLLDSRYTELIGMARATFPRQLCFGEVLAKGDL